MPASTDHRAAISITAVVPMYNAEETISDCLDSIAAQRKRPVRVIVIDDASTDSCAEIARRHPLPDLEIVSSPHNRGPGAARNDGARRATTDWLTFLDADNVWQPEFLEQVCAAVTALHAEFGSSGGTRRLVSPGPATISRMAEGHDTAAERSRDFWRMAVRFLPIVPSSTVVRRDLFERAGGFPEDVRTGEDITFAARLWLLADRFAFVNRPLYVSIQRPLGITAGSRRYHDLAMLLGRVGRVLLRAIVRRKPGTSWLFIVFVRMVIGRHALWLRQQLRP